MLRAVESIEKVHPVWQALISARWRDSDDTLKRTKGLFKVLADTIDDQFKKIYLSCNPTLGCLHKRRAPGTEQIQVTIAEYDFDIQTINMCESFFGRALQGGMQCLDNLPIGQYKSPGRYRECRLFSFVTFLLGTTTDKSLVRIMANP